MGNLDRGSIKLNKIEYIEESESIDPKDKITYGDLFFNTRNTLDLVGKVSIWKNELPYAYYNSNLMLLKFSNNFFMNYAFNSPVVLKKLRAIATGTTSVAAIYNKDLFQIKLKTPSLTEQTKIANFLTAVDEKITQLTQKHDLLTQYKKGVMQQIFSQELRFKDDDGKEFPEWEAALIGERINEKSAKFNPDKQSYFMKCIELEHLSQNTGELLGHTDTSTSKSIKNKFEKGDVLFGKLRPYLKKYLKAPFSGVCSTEIWVLKGRGISNEYLFQFVQTESFVTQTNISSGSKMPRADWGVVSCAYSYFPCPEEQIKIANFLTAIDDKITVTQTQLKVVKQYKQGLLQQMFV